MRTEELRCLWQQHMAMLAADYHFPMSDEDALALHTFYVNALHDRPESGHLLARLVVAATIELSSYEGFSPRGVMA